MTEGNTTLLPGGATKGESEADAAARTEAIRKAYTAAEKDLREKYREDFNTLVAKHAAKAGYDWKPRKTAEERAEEELKTLLANNPALAAKIKAGEIA